MDQKMKMIWHKAICQDITVRCQVLPDLGQEIIIVLFIIKETLTIVTTVIDMVNLSGFEFHTGEVLITECQGDPEGHFKNRGIRNMFSLHSHIYFP